MDLPSCSSVTRSGNRRETCNLGQPCGRTSPAATLMRPVPEGTFVSRVRSCMEKAATGAGSRAPRWRWASSLERARGQAVHQEFSDQDREEQHGQHDHRAAGGDLALLRALVVHEVDDRHGCGHRLGPGQDQGEEEVVPGIGRRKAVAEGHPFEHRGSRAPVLAKAGILVDTSGPATVTRASDLHALMRQT